MGLEWRISQTWKRRFRRPGSLSVSNRRATYGYATSRNLNWGSSAMQMPSWIRRDRMTRAYRCGIRMGYWYTSLLNCVVTVLKLKVAMLFVLESCALHSAHNLTKIMLENNQIHRVLSPVVLVVQKARECDGNIPARWIPELGQLELCRLRQTKTQALQNLQPSLYNLHWRRVQRRQSKLLYCPVKAERRCRNPHMQSGRLALQKYSPGVDLL